MYCEANADKYKPDEVPFTWNERN